MTWQHKVMWPVGLFALFLSGLLSFQAILQGITALAQPSFWWQRWQAWAAGMSPIEFFKGQWSLLTADPTSWFVMVFVWTAVLLAVLAVVAISIYCIAVLISAAKMKFFASDNVFAAFKEAVYHFKGVFWAVVLTQLASSILIIVFSIPTVWLGANNTNAWKLLLLIVFFFIFLVLSYGIAMTALYSVMFIIIEDYNLSSAVPAAWKIFRQYWFITLEMFVIQLFIAVLLAITVVIAVSLFAIPLIIIGLILVSNQIFDITVFLPKLILYLSSIVLVVVAATYTVFELYSWSFMFMNIEKIRPHSRFVRFLEMKLMK